MNLWRDLLLQYTLRKKGTKAVTGGCTFSKGKLLSILGANMCILCANMCILGANMYILGANVHF